MPVLAKRPELGADGHGRCVLRLTLLRGSSSGKHKFKLRGVRVLAGNVTADPLQLDKPDPA